MRTIAFGSWVVRRIDVFCKRTFCPDFILPAAAVWAVSEAAPAAAREPQGSGAFVTIWAKTHGACDIYVWTA